MGIKKALVTGASAGIGKELALLLAKEGFELILVAKNHQRLESAANEIGATSIQADLATKEGVASLCAYIEKEAPDVVVNNAGIGFYGPSIERDQDIIEINVQALVTISHAAVRACLQRKKSGIILNISSVLAFFPAPYAAVYAASKSFVNSFSYALDAEVKHQGVRVLCACPGQVATDFRVRASLGKASRQKPGLMVLDPKKVAYQLLQQIQTQKCLSVIDWRYKLLVVISRFLPNRCIAWVVSRVMKQRTLDAS